MTEPELNIGQLMAIMAVLVPGPDVDDVPGDLYVDLCVALVPIVDKLAARHSSLPEREELETRYRFGTGG